MILFATNAILTGSHVYGTPGEKSDVDLVVLMDPAQAADLAAIMGAELNRGGEGNYPALQFRAGMLNLIVESDVEAFAVWRAGTEALVKKRPVTREEAVAMFKRLRGERADKEGK